MDGGDDNAIAAAANAASADDATAAASVPKFGSNCCRCSQCHFNIHNPVAMSITIYLRLVLARLTSCSCPKKNKKQLPYPNKISVDKRSKVGSGRRPRQLSCLHWELPMLLATFRDQKVVDTFSAHTSINWRQGSLCLCYPCLG